MLNQNLYNTIECIIEQGIPCRVASNMEDSVIVRVDVKSDECAKILNRVISCGYELSELFVDCDNIALVWRHKI